MKRYRFVEPKQGLFKLPNGLFHIVTLGGTISELNKQELIVYLSSDGAFTYSEIKATICKYYRYYDIEIKEIERIIAELIKKRLIKFIDDSLSLHEHYSFNENVLKRIDEDVASRKILSLGQIEIAITNQCPFDCSYCSKKENSGLELLKRTDLEKIICDAYKMGANTVTFTGGEPLYENAIDTTLYLAKLSYNLGYKRIMVLTSGYGITDHITELVEAGITEITLPYNLDNSTEENAKRNKYLEEHIFNIRKLREFNIKINICCVIDKLSIMNVDQVIAFAMRNNLNTVHFYPVMPVGNATLCWNDIKVTSEELSNLMEHLKKMRSLYKNRIIISTEQMYLSSQHNISICCEAGIFWLYVGETGQIATCACAPLSNLNIKEKSLQSIWEDDDIFGSFRADSDREPCRSCPSRVNCISNCAIRQRRAIEDGLFYGGRNCALLRNLV